MKILQKSLKNKEKTCFPLQPEAHFSKNAISKHKTCSSKNGKRGERNKSNGKLWKISEIRSRKETALPTPEATSINMSAGATCDLGMASPPRFGASPLATQKINRKSMKHRQ